MFHPLGPQPPSVYWRRRLLLLGSIGLLIVLLILTAKIAASNGTDPQAAASTTPAQTTPVASTTHDRARSNSSSNHPSSPARSTTPASGSSSSSAAPQRCAAKDLAVTAVTTQPTYHVGDQPVLEMQVTNRSSEPCVQDLADRQVELRVYNGESRVWGSHDCLIQPGTDDRVLAVDTPVRVAITWSGLTSQPHCAGTRQRVGAGTYTLYPILSGHTGKATQFTIS